MSIGLQIGSRLPAYCTSMGRVLLAALPAETAAERLSESQIDKLTPHSITNLKTLSEEVAKVRERGYSVIDQELELGLRSIAVPVYDAGGRVVAAMNVGVQVERASVDDLIQKFLPPLRDAQAALRRMIT